jgi:hypothetical protein
LSNIHTSAARADEFGMKTSRPAPETLQNELQFQMSLLNLMNLGSMDPCLAAFADHVMELRQTLEASSAPAAAA